MIFDSKENIVGKVEHDEKCWELNMSLYYPFLNVTTILQLKAFADDKSESYTK